MIILKQSILSSNIDYGWAGGSIIFLYAGWMKMSKNKSKKVMERKIQLQRKAIEMLSVNPTGFNAIKRTIRLKYEIKHERNEHQKTKEQLRKLIDVYMQALKKQEQQKQQELFRKG